MVRQRIREGHLTRLDAVSILCHSTQRDGWSVIPNGGCFCGTAFLKDHAVSFVGTGQTSAERSGRSADSLSMRCRPGAVPTQSRDHNPDCGTANGNCMAPPFDVTRMFESDRWRPLTPPRGEGLPYFERGSCNAGRQVRRERYSTIRAEIDRLTVGLSCAPDRAVPSLDLFLATPHSPPFATSPPRASPEATFRALSGKASGLPERQDKSPMAIVRVGRSRKQGAEGLKG